MEQSDFERIRGQARVIGQVLSSLRRSLAEEDIELDEIVTHSPLMALGMAAGLGAALGYFAGKRGRQPELPALPDTQANGSRIPAIARDFVAKLRPLGEEGLDLRDIARDYLDELVPKGIEKVRERLPELPVEEVSQVAREWVENVVEPGVNRGLDSLVETAYRSRWGSLLRDVLGEHDSPEDPPEENSL